MFIILTVLRHKHFLNYINHLRDKLSSVTRQRQTRENIKTLHLHDSMTSGTCVMQTIYVSVLAKSNCIPKWFNLFSLFVL